MEHEKYELEFTEGCVAFSYLINGVEVVDCDDKSLIEVIVHKLVRRNNNRKDIYGHIVDCLSIVHDSGGDIREYVFVPKRLFDCLSNEIETDLYGEVENWNKEEQNLNEVLRSLSEYEFEDVKADLICMIDRIIFKEYYDAGTVQDMLIRLVKEDSETVYDCSSKPCECCGDYIEHYKLTIEI